MGTTRRKHSAEFKAKVAVEAVKGIRTMSELSSIYKVHPTAIGQWKRRLLDGATGVFGGDGGALGKSEEDLTGPLYETIGRLEVEVDWLKKKL